MAGAYIVDLTAVRAQDPQPAPPWEKVDVDLNRGAKGDYIWLYLLRGDVGRAVTSLYVSIGTNPPPAGYHRIPLDLNAGAGGDYVYLCYSRDRNLGAPIRNVGVIAARNNVASLIPTGWQILQGDLNSGAGGDFVHVIFER
ncbi:MAG: hypothetical protein QM820_47430 [Minicystis sp.]